MEVRPVLYSIAEVRQLLGGISESTVRRQIKAGNLESVLVGRRRMITARSIDGLVDQIVNGTVEV